MNCSVCCAEYGLSASSLNRVDSHLVFLWWFARRVSMWSVRAPLMCVNNELLSCRAWGIRSCRRTWKECDMSLYTLSSMFFIDRCNTAICFWAFSRSLGWYNSNPWTLFLKLCTSGLASSLLSGWERYFNQAFPIIRDLQHFLYRWEKQIISDEVFPFSKGIGLDYPRDYPK